MFVNDEIVYANRVENAITDAGQDKTTSLSLTEHSIGMWSTCCVQNYHPRFRIIHLG